MHTQATWRICLLWLGKVKPEVVKYLNGRLAEKKKKHLDRRLDSFEWKEEKEKMQTLLGLNIDKIYNDAVGILGVPSFT